MASQLASADSMTIFAAPIVADQAFPSGDPLTRSACHPIVERKNDSLHAMTEEEQQCITVQEKGRAVLSRPSRCQVARRMSSEPSAGILEVANEHGERKVAEGSSAVPQPKDFGRPDSTSDVEDEKREPDEAQDRGSETQGGNIKNLSMMSAFRDFFLAAFSDSYSYQDHYGCCGSDTTYCTVPRGGKHVAPEQDCLRTQNSSRSYHDLEPSASHDSSRKRRKKPLAIAVGFNYANDMNGRPVVITRGASASAATPGGGSAMSRRPIPGDLRKAASGGRSVRNHANGSAGSSSGSKQKPSAVSARSNGTSDSQRRQHPPKGYAV